MKRRFKIQFHDHTLVGEPDVITFSDYKSSIGKNYEVIIELSSSDDWECHQTLTKLLGNANWKAVEEVQEVHDVF